VIRLYRKLAGIHCPACDAVQPVANLRMTYANGFAGLALHRDVDCVRCAKRLRFVERHGKAETWGLRLVFGICQLILTVIMFFGFMVPLVGLFGMWGLFGLPVYVVAATLIGAWFFGLTWPLILEVRI